MENEIKILTVEDSPQDLDLILQQLKKDGIHYSSLNVDTRNDFIKELADYNPDIVISDYSLTSFDGLTAIELINDLSPFTSVIIVTGLNNDDLAVLCIKKGADDYILQNNISRLGFAINGALENKKLKKEQELQKKKLLKLNRNYTFIGKINEMIVRILDEEKLFEEACKIAVELGEYPLVWIGLLDEKNKFIKPHTWYGVGEGFLEEIREMSVDDVLRNDPAQNRLLMGSYFVCNNIIKEDCGFILKKNAVTHGFRSLISIPLILHTNVIGSFNVYAHEPDIFNEDEIKLLLEVAGAISFSLGSIAKEKEKTISELKYRRLFESAKDGIIILNAENGKIVDVNPFITNNLDYLKEDLIGKQLWEIGFLKDSIINKNSYFELLEHEYIRYEDLPLRKKDGTSMDVEFISNVYYVDGVKVIQCNIRDITNRKRIEEALHDSEDQLRQSFDYSAAGMCIVGIDKKFRRINNAFKEMMGYDEDEIMNLTFLNITHPDDASVGSDEYDKMLNGEIDKVSFDKRYIRKDKRVIWTHVSSSLIRNISHQPQFYISQLIDITEQKTALQELIESKEIAVSANKLKDAFIANISHEIRTPLNGILGMASLIKDSFLDVLTKEDEELFDGIDISSQRLIRTVDLILNYSRLQVGEYPFYRKKIDLSSVCQNLVREYAVEAKTKLVEVLFQNDCGDTSIFADEYSITLAVSNLLSNAVKFTNKGFINVTIYKNYSDEIILEVKDTGIGIGEEYLDKIFEPYYQENMGYARAYDGIGLGLALVKKVLDLNNARVFVESKKGEGASFYINFGKVVNPVEKIIKTTGIHDIPRATEKPVVLIVEDDFINQTTVKRFIEKNYSSIFADSSDKAMLILKKEKIDLILMDISINGEMNGLELTKELKMSKELSHIPVIAITAHAFEEDKQNALDAGCAGFLAKPFTKESLLEIIKVFVNKPI